MTTKTTETTTTTAPHWAAALGREVAESRAAHEAEAAAEAAATGQRLAVPTAGLAQRFADVAVRVVEAVDAFATAAGIDVTSEPPTPGSLQLRSGDDVLALVRQDEDLRVTFRSRSRGDAFGVQLASEPFDPEPAARRIAQQFIDQLSITHGGPHVSR